MANSSVFTSGFSLGFSLVELLVSLVVLSILITMTAANMPQWAHKKSLQADLDQFVTTIAMARYTAVVKGVNITMCPGRGDRCGPRNHWHLGTMVFVDHNANQRVDGADTVLSRLPPMRNSRVTWRAFRSRAYLQFTASGMTDWQNGNFLFCPESGAAEQARQLVLNYAGRMYFSDDRDNDGIDEDVRGRPLSCSR